MPESDMGVGGENAGGKDGGTGGGGIGAPPGGEAITLPGAIPDDAPGGACGEVIKVLQQQWQAERDRAQQAEQAAIDFRTRLREVEAALAQARKALDAAERRHQIDLMLIEQETVDLESSRLLTELALTQMPERDVATAVGDLRRRKPFLFRSKRNGRLQGAGAAMSATALGSDPAEQAAEEAARSGDRGALLRYLRARRGA